MASGLGVDEYHEHTAKWRRLMDVTIGASTKAVDPADIAPEMIAPFVVWLCTDAAGGVNGRTFFVSGDRVSMLSEPKPQTTIARAGGWTLDALDEVAPIDLVAGQRNRYLLDGHPELQVFPD